MLDLFTKASTDGKDMTKDIQYTIENGRNYNPEYFPEESIKILGEKLILDFGDTWFLKEYIHRLPFYESIANILSENPDTMIDLDKAIAIAKKVHELVGHEADGYILKAGKSSELVRDLPKGQGKNETQK